MVAVLSFGPVLYQLAHLARRAAALGADEVWLGWTQFDQPFYFAAARELFERGNGLFAANPFDLRPDAPRLYTHLGTVLFGWIWRLTGAAPHHIDLAVRLTLGPAMLVLGVALMGQWIRHRALAWPLALGVLWGGGLAWAIGLLQAVQVMLLGGEAPGGGWDFLFLWRLLWRQAMGGFGGWGLALGRQVESAPECLYHVLALSTLLALARGRPGWAVVGMALTCWAHPFTGLLIGLVTVFALGLECRLGRAKPRRALATAAAIFALFLTYNGVVLPSDPGHREVARTIRDFAAPLAWGMVIPAYGLWIILPWLGLLGPARCGRVLARRRTRLLVVWTAVTAALVFNDRWLGPLGLRAISPLHFSRGYLMLALVIWSGRGLLALARRAAWSSRRLAAVATAVVLLSMPDTLDALTWASRQSVVLSLPRRDWALLRCLDTVRPGMRLALVSRERGADWLGLWLPVYTPHTGVGGHRFNTPNREERLRRLQAFVADESGWGPLAALGIEAVAVPASEEALWRARLAGWWLTPLDACEDWTLWRVRRAPDGG